MTVTVYTAPACGGCIATKRQLEKCGINYHEAPIDEIREAALAEGIIAAPVVAINGQPAWGGFRPDRIKALVA